MNDCTPPPFVAVFVERAGSQAAVQQSDRIRSDQVNQERAAGSVIQVQ